MKNIRVIFLLLVLLTAMIGPFGPAQAASKQLNVSGEILFNLVEGSFVADKVVGGNDPVIWEDSIVMGSFLFDIIYTGDISGTATEAEYGRWNTKNGEWPIFKVNSTGLQEFSGSILGMTGTFTARTRHQGDRDGRVKIEQTIVSGTGELTNLRGTLVFYVYFDSEFVHPGPYSGKLHFAP